MRRLSSFCLIPLTSEELPDDRGAPVDDELDPDPPWLAPEMVPDARAPDVPCAEAGAVLAPEAAQPDELHHGPEVRCAAAEAALAPVVVRPDELHHGPEVRYEEAVAVLAPEEAQPDEPHRGPEVRYEEAEALVAHHGAVVRRADHQHAAEEPRVAEVASELPHEAEARPDARRRVAAG